VDFRRKQRRRKAALFAACSYLKDEEFKMFICGKETVEAKELENIVAFLAFDRDNLMITWFWQIIRRFNNYKMELLLQFWTGSSTVQFKKNIGESKNKYLQVLLMSERSPDALPQSSTCDQLLILSIYPSMEVFEQKLEMAIQSIGDGFHLI
jgi:hypothetical protein